jgi:hypothetical protein
MSAEIPYAPAVVQQQSASHAPVLSAGRVTIAAMRVFENACCWYFQHKSVAEADRVLAVIYNFEGSLVQAWVNANHAHLMALTFPLFILEFKKKFLPRNWQDDLIAMQIGLQGNIPFLTWTEAVHEANSELGIAKSDYYIEEDKLHPHFIPRLSPALKVSYDVNNTHQDLDKIEDLDAWIKQVHLLDTELAKKWVEWLKFAMERNAKTGQAAKMASTKSRNASSGSTHPLQIPQTGRSVTPRLTPVKHQLLEEHQGCFRCRVFYSGHFSANCPLGPNERPLSEACMNITTAHTLKAKTAFERSQKATVVAAVFENEEDEADYLLNEDELDEYVDDNFSLPKHLWWDCCIDAPATCAPTPIHALIDHGSTPVLILSEFANIMALKRRKLFKPFSVSGAFVEKEKEMDSITVLNEYCKVHLQS